MDSVNHEASRANTAFKQTPHLPLPLTIRSRLIAEVLDLARKASQIPDVLRIALIGSLTTNKLKPKDADLLITVTDKMDLAPLAKLGRQLNGHAQRFNHGSEIFLSDPHGHYLGRTCH
jgi:hypothetical protein